jgi:hypothetical protein
MPRTDPILPAEQDISLARAAANAVQRLGDGDMMLRIAGTEVALPPVAVPLLRQMLEALTEGRAVAIATRSASARLPTCSMSNRRRSLRG